MLAISDIHGNIEKFQNLLKKVNYNKDNDQLLLLGDYIDRGPHSRAVIDKVIELKNDGAIALLGNHEKMMMDAFSGDPMCLKRWYYNGGIKTLENYGYEIANDDAKFWFNTDIMPEPIQVNEEIRQHIRFLEELPYYYETDTHIFVHAGIDPHIPLEENKTHTLVWIRDDFHQEYNGQKTVVFGHTPTKYLHKSHEVYFGENNIIGIDGGCAYGGRLYCLDVTSSKVIYID